ncbi:hypothetical protein BDAP_002086 [Binucleata daphniae]
MNNRKNVRKNLEETLKTDINLQQIFTSPHTITCLVLMIVALIYFAFYIKTDTIRLGFVITYFVFMLISLLQSTDSVFRRPHPAIWRIVKGTSIYYLMILVFVLFQDKNDVRQWLKHLDSSLGVPLPEKSYATACSLTYTNIYNQIDLFVPAHIFGWYFKALILRDYYLCWLLSVMFEVMEYSLEHQLPNFAECWWDHWILDVFTCNAIGIHLGIKTCRYFNAKMYKWRGTLPENEFVLFQWLKGADTFKKYIGIIVLISVILASELNTFYLKYLLWIPSDHVFNLIRLIIHVSMGCVAIREGYSYFTDKMCKSFGYQLWLCIACIAVESLICIKYSQGEFKNPFPLHIKIFWAVLITILTLFPIVKYVLCRKTKNKRD